MSDTRWHREAACYRLGGDLFDSDTWHSPALALCATCPVKMECATDALSRKSAEDCGIWGFASLAQRDRIRRRQTDLATVWSHNEQRLQKELVEKETAAQVSLFDELAQAEERRSKVELIFA